jgi:hypothetical protein
MDSLLRLLFSSVLVQTQFATDSADLKFRLWPVEVIRVAEF